MGRTEQQAMRQQAEEARAQWAQAAAAGRDHAFVQAKWEAYTALAHRAGAYMDIEHEAALRESRRVIEGHVNPDGSGEGDWSALVEQADDA